VAAIETDNNTRGQDICDTQRNLKDKRKAKTRRRRPTNERYIGNTDRTIRREGSLSCYTDANRRKCGEWE
jgi:hypothetical protein